jgi:hypothetical protein
MDMATKSNGKSSSQRSSSQKGSASRKSTPARHGKSGNGSIGQQKTNPSSSRSSKSSRSSSGSSRKSSQGGSSRSKQGMGGKLTSSIKQHPIVSAAVGAGAGLLLIEGVRRAISGAFGGSDKSQQNDRSQRDSDSEENEDSEAQGSHEDQSDSDDDSEDEGGDDDDEDDAQSRQGQIGMRHAAKQGYEHGRQLAADGWQQYPLVICAAALGLGAVAGMLLPSSSLEDQTFGTASDKLAGQLKSAGSSLKDLVGKAYDEAASTAAQEAERIGITPDRLTRKVKRLAVKVRDAVTDAVQG